MSRMYWMALHSIKKWNKGQLNISQVEQMARYFTDLEFDISRLSKKNQEVLLAYRVEVSKLFMD